MLETEWRVDSLRLVEQVRARAEAKGMTSGQFALHWLLDNRIVSAVLAGPRSVEQWEEYLASLTHGFDAEDADFIDGLVPPGYASTYGYNDPQYPVRGRLSTSAESG